jgi:hypothetical protein
MGTRPLPTRFRGLYLGEADVNRLLERGPAAAVFTGHLASPGTTPFPKTTGGARSFGRGGLTDLVAAVDSLIAAAALAALIALSGSVAAIAAVAGVGFVLALAAHAAYLEHSYHGTWLHPLCRRLLSRFERSYLGTWLLPLWSRLLSRWWKPREVESSLAVVSERPEAVLRTIEGRDEIAGHALGATRSERIQDRYLDTSDRRLEMVRIALRVREQDGRMLITLKGPSATGRWGGEDRLELERDWSKRAWKEVREELQGRGVAIRAPSTGPSSALETLAAAGFEIVQDRAAERRIRDVRPRGGGQGRVAELALDTVTYHFPGRDVRHYEVEIEAKTRRGAEAVAAVATALVDRYWPRLRPWRHGKLPTGKTVAALLAEGRVPDLVGRDGALKPQAYDAIADALEHSPQAATAP